jgi:putative MFS transporter
MSAPDNQAVEVAQSVQAAQRLDRLPASRWLTSVMAILFLGWLVESYDIGLTGSVLPSLTAIYHLSTGLKSLVSISSSAGVVLGIVPAGWLADRVGRKRVMIGGTIAYSILTFLTGFAPGIASVVTLRVLAGVAMGAVFPLPYAYGAELCPPALRGRFTGIADTFLSVGYFLSPLLALVLIPSATNGIGWRVMFLLGGLPIVFAFLAWKYVPESPRWSEAKGRFADAGSPQPPVPAPLRHAVDHLRRALLRLLLDPDVHANGCLVDGLLADVGLRVHRGHRAGLHPGEAG